MASSTKNTVFVAGFGPTVTKDDLRSALEVHGEVKRAQIRKTKRVFAFVEFADDESASKAVAAGLTIGDDTCTIEIQNKPPRAEKGDKKSSADKDGTSERRRSKKTRAEKPKAVRKNTIFVKGVAITKTEEELNSAVAALRAQFEPHGTVSKVEYKGRGYGFVTFEDAESMQKAVAAGNVTTSDGAEYVVEESTGRSSPRVAQTGPTTTIYVKNLPEIDDAGIEALFASYGTITRVANLSGTRGFAFVSFETEEQMQKAAGAESLTVGENTLVIEVQKRQPKAARQAE